MQHEATQAAERDMSVAVSPPSGLPGSEARGLASRAVRGGAVLMAARLAMQLLAWPITLLVARILTPYDYGLLTTGAVILGLPDLLAEAGVGKALIQKKDLTPDDLAGAFSFSLLLSTLLYAVIIAIAWPVAWFMDTPALPLLLIVLGSLILLVPIRAVCAAILDRELRLGSQAQVHVVSNFLQTLLVLGLALAGAGYWALAGGVIAGRCLESASLLWLAGWRPRVTVPRAGHQVVMFGLNVSGSSVLWFIYSNADFAVVGKLLGAVVLGYYSLAFQLVSLPVHKLTHNLNQVVYPVFCRLQDDRERLRGWFLRLTVLLGCLGVPTLLGMALVAEDAFLLILKPKWEPAILPFRLLTGAGVVMVYASSLPPLFNALGRPEINLRYTAVCALSLPAAFVLGGWAWGVAGICLAWLIVFPLIVAGLVVFTRKVSGIGLVQFLWAQREVIAAAVFMTVCVLLLQWTMQGTDRVWRLLASIAAGAAAYSAFLLVVSRRTIVADFRLLLAELRGRR